MRRGERKRERKRGKETATPFAALRRSSRVFMNTQRRLGRKRATLDRRAFIRGERIDVFFRVARSIEGRLPSLGVAEPRGEIAV